MSFGVVYIATENYSPLAELSMWSLPSHVGDSILQVHIEPAESVEDAFRKRLTLPHWSPFEDTLYLDCDMVLVNSRVLDYIFGRSPQSYFESPRLYFSGVAMCGWQVADVEWLWPKAWEKQKPSCLDARVIPNSGLMAFKSSRSTWFFDGWKAAWESRLGSFGDEIALIEPSFLATSLQYYRLESWVQVPNWALWNSDLLIGSPGFVHCMGDNKLEEMRKVRKYSLQ